MKLNRRSPGKHVILAVDLKAEDLGLTARIWNALQPLIKDQNTVVEPVSILNREDAAVGSILKSRIGKLRTATERHLAEELAGMGLEGLADPKVLYADGSSTERAVQALLAYAKKVNCDLIAVSSHSRKGLSRVFLGSFAETLSLRSTIPLLVVNPRQRPQNDKGPILFPTDFSAESKAGLSNLLRSFPQKRSKLILFHKFVYPTQVQVGPYASYSLPQKYVDDAFKQTEKKGQQWCKELRKQGLKCELVMDRRSVFVTDGILTAAKRNNVATIAMVSATGKLGAFFLGSVTRNILRSSGWPVWVVHPKAKAGKVQLKLVA